MQKRRASTPCSYASVSLVRRPSARAPASSATSRRRSTCGAIAAMIVALARPRRPSPSRRTPAPHPRRSTSPARCWPRTWSPTAWRRRRTAVREFVEKQPKGVKIGVVSFSDFAALVAPPSTDRKQALDAIARLRPQRGTNIGAGLQVALDAIYEQPRRTSADVRRPHDRCRADAHRRRAADRAAGAASSWSRTGRATPARPAGVVAEEASRQASRSTRSASARRRARSCRSRAATSSPPSMKRRCAESPTRRAAYFTAQIDADLQRGLRRAERASASSRTRRRRLRSPSPAPPC